MKFLLIGASGFVGGNIMAFLRSRGFTVMGTQSRPRREGLITFDLLHHRITDCVDRSFFQGPEKVHVLVCAVVGSIDRCLTDRSISHTINVAHTIRLIDDVSALGAKVTFFSSCYVFDGERGYYNEDAPTSPINEYGRHKLEVENYLKQNVPGSLVLRLEKVIGHNPAEDHFFTQWHKLLAEGKPICCIEGSLLSPTWVNDIALGFLRASELDVEGLYHLANSEFFFRDELARQFCWTLGRPANVITKPLEGFHFLEKRPLKTFLDGSRFVKKTGLHFTPMRDLFHEFIRRLRP
jgi:dTDP-4-dehydrorhamnose reductase